MKKGVFGVFLALIVAATANAADDSPFTIEFEKLAPGVWAGLRPDPVRAPVMGNTVFVVGEDSVIVFDGGGAPAMSDLVIDKIRSLTDLPVTDVVISHWHGDHAFGIHRFVLGDTTGGILRIVITFVTCGAGSIIGFIEGIIYVTKSDEDFIKTYQVEKKAWF